MTHSVNRDDLLWGTGNNLKNFFDQISPQKYKNTKCLYSVWAELSTAQPPPYLFNKRRLATPETFLSNKIHYKPVSCPLIHTKGWNVHINELVTPQCLTKTGYVGHALWASYPSPFNLAIGAILWKNEPFKSKKKH